MSGIRDSHNTEHDLPLLQRLPDYAAILGVGLAGACGLGVVVGVLSSASVATAVGYTLFIVGAVWLLSGGLVGGGYSVFGIGQGIGRRTYVQGDGNESVMEEMRQGYRPEANRGALWRVVGGAIHVALGVILLMLTS